MLDGTRQPDLLRRFVATPYVLTHGVGSNRRSIRSNDLEIALAVRRYWSNQRRENNRPIGSWQLIRDVLPSTDSSEISFLFAQELRTLMVGTETILFYDVLRSELLGFLSSTMKVQNLILQLLPKLLEN
jgi:hypothetical protein